MKKMFKNNKGFTLTEIVVVIAIIGVLAVALVPKLNSFLGKADRVGATVDFQSTFSNLYRVEMIEKAKLMEPAKFEAEMTDQFDIDKTATALTAGDFTALGITDGAPTPGDNDKVIELSDGTSAKTYTVIFKMTDATTVDKVLFVATNTPDNYSLLISQKAGKTRDIQGLTGSLAEMLAEYQK